MFILRSFKSNDFATADSTGFADAFFVTAHSREFAGVDHRQSVVSADVAESVTMQGSVASAKLLVGFAVHVPSLVIVCQRKTDSRPALRQRKRAKLAMTCATLHSEAGGVQLAVTLEGLRAGSVANFRTPLCS